MKNSKILVGIVLGIPLLLIVVFLGLTWRGWFNYFNLQRQKIYLSDYHFFDMTTVSAQMDLQNKKIRSTAMILIYPINRNCILTNSSYGIKCISLNTDTVLYFNMISSKSILGDKFLQKQIDSGNISSESNSDPTRENREGIHYRWVSTEDLSWNTFVQLMHSGDVLTVGRDPDTWKIYYLGLVRRFN